MIGILSLTGLFVAVPVLHIERYDGRAVADIIWPNAVWY